MRRPSLPHRLFKTHRQRDGGARSGRALDRLWQMWNGLNPVPWLRSGIRPTTPRPFCAIIQMSGAMPSGPGPTTHNSLRLTLCLRRRSVLGREAASKRHPVVQACEGTLAPGTGAGRGLLPVVPGHCAATRQLRPRVTGRHRRARPPPRRHQGGQLYTRPGEVLCHPDTGAVA